MAKPKKGALHQLLVTMVDATDFASVESAITESDFNSGVTKKFYGVNTGGSAATTSGTISKTASLVRSGVFRLTLKTTENNYDAMQVRINKTGCAEQIYEWQNVDNDDSDMMSAITALASLASDAHSAAAQANSRVLVVQSFASDIRSHVSDLQSDFQSRVPKLVATNSQLSDLHSDLRSHAVQIMTVVGVELGASTLSDLRSAIAAGPGATVTASDISDIASAVRALLASDLSDILSAAAQANSRVLVVQSIASDVRSHVSDLQSDFQSRVPKAVATNSQVSDLLSDIKSALAAVELGPSSMSDLRSAITAGPAGAVTASDMSDIASRVEVVLASRLSDILSAAVQTNSRVLVVQSMVSDLQSVLSNVNSVAASSPTASDIASKVWAETIGAALASRMLVVVSQVSDIRSQVSDLQSDFQSRVPKLVATNSQLSDLASDLKSAVGGITASVSASDMSDIASRVDVLLASRLSDILSAAVQTNSRVLVIQSIVSDVRSHVSDLQSDFQSRVPKLVATNSQLSDLQSDLRSLIVTGVELGASTMSDIRSAITAGATGLDASALSDIASAVVAAIGAAGVEIGPSSMSDLRSAITAVASLASDAHSAAAQGSSRALLAQSLASDAHSAATVGSSRAALAASRALVVQSQASDIYSLLSDLHSDVGVLSGVVSDVYSHLQAGVTIGAAAASDLASKVWVRAGADPTAAPAPTAGMGAKLDWLTALATNKMTETATHQKVRNAADNANIASAVLSDDNTTFTRGPLG